MAPLLGQADPFKRSAESDTRDVEIEK